MFRYLRNVLTGRLAHFNTIRPLALKRYTSRLHDLPEHHQVFFDALLMTIDFELDDLFGFGDYSRFFKFDVRVYSENQLSEVYQILSFTHVYWFCKANPSMRENLLRATGYVMESPENLHLFLNEIEPTISGTSEADASQVFFVGWNHIASTLEGRRIKDPFQVQAFASLMSVSHKELVRLVRERLPAEVLMNF